MGVTTIVGITSNSKNSIESQYEELVSRLEKRIQVKPQKRGSYHATMHTYIANKKETVSCNGYDGQLKQEFFTRKFYQLSVSEYPISNFIVHDPIPIRKSDQEIKENFLQMQQRKITTQAYHNFSYFTTPTPSFENATIVDKNFPGIINCLIPHVYSHQKTKIIEAIGQRFEFDDFIICPAIINVGQQPKGLIISIEYTAMVIAEFSEALLKDFFIGLKLAKNSKYQDVNDDDFLSFQDVDRLDREHQENNIIISDDEDDMSDKNNNNNNKKSKKCADNGVKSNDPITKRYYDVTRTVFRFDQIRRVISNQVNNLSMYRPSETALQYVKVFNKVRSNLQVF